ncbi:uncharacterized protein FA14DRAFT_154120 [Meira miltonrushii]|uniref:F-box domain-containing protein n=1 Tax=Meira miltonrushii TaxID=1280837 RepID=A0A316VAL0_9BASI|nr:uncharacterized protein FA14DRAFT_154120 [Meira miltonrushii]PWN34669.1 hypothetical protein FA14DRAFT_154120 [Meira miltonrushii]
MEESNSNLQDDRGVSVSSSNPSARVQLPIELISNIWRHLSLQDRVKIQQVSKLWREYSCDTIDLWKDALYLRDDLTKADICKDIRALSHVGRWTGMKFCSLTISLQYSTFGQIKASRTFFNLLPAMDVKNLIITSKATQIFATRGSGKKGSLELSVLVHHLRSLQGPTVIDDTFKAWGSAMKDLELTNKTIWNLAYFNAISNCSKLRCLILQFDCKILFHFSKDMPISQCKLDILSIRNNEDDSFPISRHEQSEAVCDMVREARVIDLIDYPSLRCDSMLQKLLSAASKTIEYLTISISALASTTPSVPTINFSYQSSATTSVPETLVIDLPKLKHLWLSSKCVEPTIELNCPNLESLRVSRMEVFKYFTRIPSIRMLFIGRTQSSLNDFDWNVLSQIGGDRLHTLYLYSDCMPALDFFKLFQAEMFPHLRKIVVLASSEKSSRIKIESFYDLTPKQLLRSRRVDSLIWQFASDDVFPGFSTQDFVREHFAEYFNCLRSDDSIKYSARIMGDFVQMRTEFDKMKHFQEFLQRS